MKLRLNYGSFPELVRVYAFDPSAGLVLCRYRYEDGKQCIASLHVDSLEAVNDSDPPVVQYHPARRDERIREMAGPEVFNEPNFQGV